MARLDDNHYENKMKDLSFTKTKNGYRLKLNLRPLGKRLDFAQATLDAQVWQDVQKYMPFMNGDLKRETGAINAVECGRVYMYPPNSPYGHYQYEGQLYVDPIYGFGGIYSMPSEKFAGGWWSRKDVKKVPSGRKLNYSQPQATSHWGETAFNNHHKEWVEVVKRALR